MPQRRHWCHIQEEGLGGFFHPVCNTFRQQRHILRPGVPRSLLRRLYAQEPPCRRRTSQGRREAVAAIAHAARCRRCRRSHTPPLGQDEAEIGGARNAAPAKRGVARRRKRGGGGGRREKIADEGEQVEKVPGK
jgi:hypothetical protein